MRVIWRRFRRGTHARYEQPSGHATQLDLLLRRADASAPWHERANWITDVAEWLRHQPKVSLLDAEGRRRLRNQRLLFLLDWLDAHRELRAQVRTCLQRTLREASGPELFSLTGLPGEASFFSELGERACKMLLPRHLSPTELPNLFAAVLPAPEDAQWLLSLGGDTLRRLRKLLADDGIAHVYWQQIEEALTYLTTLVVADGISPAFRQRLEPKMPLQATPFMALRREMEAYLRASPHDRAALRSVRMLLAVCRAQTDRIYAHLDEYGVSVSLVYRVERMRAQLTRMGRLIDVRAGADEAAETHAGGGLPLLLADLVAAQHQRSSVRSLVRRSFSLLARKMVERHRDHGETYLARDRQAYWAVFRAACLGGGLSALTVLVSIMLEHITPAHFFDGALASLNYVLSFLLIALTGGVLAGRQSAVTAPALAAGMGELDSTDGLRGLLTEVRMLLRSQAAGLFGNWLAVVPAVLLISAVTLLMAGAPLMPEAQAQAAVRQLSLIGPTPLYAMLTGGLLCGAGLVAGFADNWFVWRRLREALTHQRRLVHALGPARAARWALWLDRHVATIAGTVSLGVLLGMTPVIAQFFGLPLQVRHATLAAGTLAAASASLGWQVLTMPGFWLALAGVAATALLNVGVAFACALALALRAREIPVRARRMVWRAMLRRISGKPWHCLFPASAKNLPVEEEASSSATPDER